MRTISVVIPLYNKEPFIERTISSVLAQTHTDFEIIIVDDGSTDESVARVKLFADERIRLINLEHGGVSAARNRGISEANSDLIAFLDADDTWKPTFLETILSLEANFPEAGAFATNYEIILPEGKPYFPKYQRIPVSKEKVILPSYIKLVKGDLPIMSSAVAVKKSVFMEIGGFLEGESLGEDQEMWFRIAQHYPISYATSREATYYRGQPNSVCADLTNLQSYAITRAIKNIVSTAKAEEKEDMKQYIIKLELDYAKRLMEAGKYSDSTQYVLKVGDWWKHRLGWRVLLGNLVRGAF